MKKAVTSYGQLINETAFSRVCKASDNLFWAIADNGHDIVINGHWIIDARLTDKARSQLFAIFGVLPSNGKMYSAQKCGRDYIVNERVSPLAWEKFFESAGDTLTVNTHLVYTDAEDREHAIYSASGTPIFLNAAYAEMIYSTDIGKTQAENPYAGVAFEYCGERAFILPVCITDRVFGFLEK